MDLEMRKSIKKIAATLLAATMALGTLTTAFAYTAEEGKITDLEEGEYIYLFGGAATEWSTDAETAIMSEVEGRKGVVKFTATIPGNENEWEHRFAVIGNYCEGDDYVQGGWSRMLLGEPAYKANDLYTCLTTVAVDSIKDADTEITVYYDTRTATLYVEDAEGNAVDYTIGWATNDRDEKFYSIDDMAAMTYDEFYAQLSKDRQDNLTAIAETTKLTYSMFKGGNYKANVEGLANYIKNGEDYVVVAEEPTTEAATTEAATTAAATEAATEAAATTAANESTKTGDVAPVALMVVLFAAVAVVAVVAKKKEA